MDVTAKMKEILRSMLQRLHPHAIDRYGLQIALRELLSGFRQRNPDTDCSLVVDPAASESGGDLAMTVYRIVQEALTNVARHAQAARMSVEIAIRPSPDAAVPATLKVTMQDDGRGFDPSAIAKGFGLLGMRERVVGLGGTLEIDSDAKRGTKITAELPWYPPDRVVA